MTEGPFYIVEDGTNHRWSTGKALVPRIFDTEKIAQIAIDRFVRNTTPLKGADPAKHVPITIAEYNRKYAKLMGIKEELQEELGHDNTGETIASLLNGDMMISDEAAGVIDGWRDAHGFDTNHLAIQDLLLEFRDSR